MIYRRGKRWNGEARELLRKGELVGCDKYYEGAEKAFFIKQALLKVK